MCYTFCSRKRWTTCLAMLQETTREYCSAHRSPDQHIQCLTCEHSSFGCCNTPITRRSAWSRLESCSKRVQSMNSSPEFRTAASLANTKITLAAIRGTEPLENACSTTVDTCNTNFCSDAVASQVSTLEILQVCRSSVILSLYRVSLTFLAC